MNTQCEQPNILFIFSDQQRPDTMGCYGQKLPVTPNLDRLAQEGIRFDRAFTCQPVCGPARAALQTGKYAVQTGCFRNDIALPRTERTMAHYLSGAGYDVGYVGKWHLASSGREQNFRSRPVPPEWRGGYKDFWVAADVLEFTSHAYDGHLFDARGRKRSFPKGRYRADAVTDFALKELEGRGIDRPFYLFLSFIEPHHQNDHHRFEGPRGSRRKFGGYEVPADLAGTGGDWRENYPDYLGACHSLDRNVGRIRAALEKRGQWENTLVIYTSDHGCHFCTRNAEYKRSCHDSSIHIPLIIRGPGFRGGRTVHELISLLDLTPTVLRGGGVKPPDAMVGKPLQDLVSGRATTWRDAVFAQISEDHIGRMIRTDRWTYSIWVPSEKRWSGVSESGSDVYVDHKLYDLEADPSQKHNLISDPRYESVRRSLRRRMKVVMKKAGESVPKILSTKKG